MEEGGGSGRHRRLSLLDQMSAIENRRELAGLTLDDVLASDKRPTVAVSHTPPQANRTLLDIIRDDEPHGSLFGNKDKKSWKAFRERLRLKRAGTGAGSAWTSSVPIPASDIPIQNSNYSFGNNINNPRSRNSMRFTTVSSPTSGESSHTEDSNDHSAVSSSGPQMSRRASSRFTTLTPSDSTRSDESSTNIHAVGGPPSRSFRPQMSRHNSIRPSESFLDSEEEPVREGRRRLGAALAEERALSAREAVAAQEAAEAEAAARAAAEAAAAAAAAEQEEEEEANGPADLGAAGAQPVRMSLMDLLEETDRQMGLEGSRYTMEDEDECEEEEEEDDEDGAADGIEHTCCVCMIRHKGAAFIPCGHTFCRLCSRELWVQRGNCPLCNGFILEILDIF
ncbi:hypothetical protein P3X46_011882 [Hevea brasiliensis]|uniref:RING-type domain-containing protein n=2 Tax=Hevea brasiliensis TaxID=3981 RepID=A0ABQ9MC97_HEVBR|nr:uncharacterized protein LOC110650825 isoform X1 [Hevea brasiliensis]KAJ9176586.1 hypothetical protein P3X46_011882 [Hevea brasiliensis]